VPVLDTKWLVTDEHILRILEDVLGKDNKQRFLVHINRTALKLQPNFSVPCIHCAVGTPGYELGIVNYVWYFNTWTIQPTDDEIKAGFREALQNLRKQKADQEAAVKLQVAKENGRGTPDKMKNPFQQGG
jgi:hypothetical protein